MKINFRIFITLVITLVLVLSVTLSTCAAANGNEPEKGQTPGTLFQPSQSDNETDYREHEALVMFNTRNSLSLYEAKSTLDSGKSGISDLVIEDLWSFEEASPGKKALSMYRDSCINVALVSSENLSTEELILKLKAMKGVRYAEPNYRIHASSVNDPYFDSQWGMQDGENTPNVMSVWDRGTTGAPDRIVAVVDTGVDYTHPDLKDRMWKNTHYPTLKGSCGYDFINGDGDPMDDAGHGTHCAGITGAHGNNQIGISGVNQDIRIMALKILDAEGSSELSHEISAYNYISQAMDLGEPVQVINNSWRGGNYSRIFAELIDVLGKKGAVSVIAAGNDGADYDEEMAYPLNIDSPYIIKVAATNTDGGIASFSNYGENTIDMAAPGTDILSTYCYYRYNPSIYSAEKQKEVSAGFNNYETETGWESVSDLAANIYLNGKPYDPDTYVGDQKIALTRTESGGFNTKGEESAGAISLAAENLNAGDLICIVIPYEISGKTEKAPTFSVMCKGVASAEQEFGLVGMSETPAGYPLDGYSLNRFYLKGGSMISPFSFDNWDHISFQTLNDEELKKAQKQAAYKRQLILTVSAEIPGDVTVYFDDMGLSYENLNPEVFEKYEFMNGTSMAAPFVSGSVALYAEATGYPVNADAEKLVSEVTSLAKEGNPDAEHPLPVIMRGALDFTKETGPAPRIGAIVVDKAQGTITINGAGLNPSSADLKVEIGLTGTAKKEAAILSRSDDQIVLKDEGWINNAVDLCLTGAGGLKAVRNDLYLIGKKNQYTSLVYLSEEVKPKYLSTDGRYIYILDVPHLSVVRVNTQDLTGMVEPLAYVDPSPLLGERRELADYGLEFDRRPVFMNQKLYVVAEVGMGSQSETVPQKVSIFSGTSYLLSIDTVSGEVGYLGELPADLQRTEDYAIAAFNGKLCFLGGFDHEIDDLTKAVIIYDPAKDPEERWSKGADLPEKRSGGQALQVGSELIYTLGSASLADEKDSFSPANLIFNGSSWRTSSIAEKDRIKALNGYSLDDISVGIANGGLAYLGVPVWNYGDTFAYSIASDAFADTGYNYIRDLSMTEFTGLTVGDTIYGFDGINMFAAPLTMGSGFPKISVNSNPGGTVSGSTILPPGNDAAFTITADEDCEIESIKVNGKTIAVENKKEQTVNIGNVITDQTLDVAFAERKTVTPKVTLAVTSYVYDGTQKTPAVKAVKVGQETLKDSEYTVKYDKGRKNVGTYKVTVTLKMEKYQGTGTASFKITKANNTISSFKPTAVQKISYNTLTKKNQTVQLSAKAKGGAKLTYALASVKDKKAKKYFSVSSAGKITVKKGLAKGTYKITVKVTAGATTNYKSKTVNKTVTIKVQ